MLESITVVMKVPTEEIKTTLKGPGELISIEAMVV